MSEKNDLGISFSFCLELLTEAGFNTRQVVTAMKIAAGIIIKPTKKAKNICASQGISALDQVGE